jgi:hypothetical protein
MENSKVERLHVGRHGREYPLRLDERKYELIQHVAIRCQKSLNRQLNELIDLGLQAFDETQQASSRIVSG